MSVLVRRIRPALLIALAAVGGCAGGLGAPKTPPPAPPVLPIQAEMADRWYRQWAYEEDIPGREVRGMSFSMSMSGRDWREPEGPDGYAIRVYLYDALSRTVKADGMLQVILVAAPGPGARPLFAWSIDAGRMPEHFRPSKPPGYLLQLDWGAAAPPPAGSALLAVKWTSLDGSSCFIQNIIFKDRIRHAITTTTRPVAAPLRTTTGPAR